MPSENTFAGQLKNFARAVDRVDAETFNGVRELIVTYIESFGATFFELVRKDEAGQNGNAEVWLRRFWASDDTRRPKEWQVRREGNFTNPISQAFATHKPMWIVGDKDETLDVATYVDHWSKTTGHPRYDLPGAEGTKTLVVVPLCTQREFGAYYVEIPKRRKISDIAMQEFKQLGEALEMMYCMFQMHSEQTDRKRDAVVYLRKLLSDAQLPRSAIPHLFKAYPDASDEQVKHSIDTVLREFRDMIEVTDWDRIYESGAIPQQISKEIAESRLGLCYFSKLVDDPGPGQPGHVDSLNVTFEAGMLHARTAAIANDTSGQPYGWIPIRESDSGPPPFDFSVERILYVPRDAQGALDKPAFEGRLRKRLQKLLGIEPDD